MSSNQTGLLEKTMVEATTEDGGVNHYYCCDKNISLCGHDITDLPIDSTPALDEGICRVCEELDMSEDFVCKLCGD